MRGPFCCSRRPAPAAASGAQDPRPLPLGPDGDGRTGSTDGRLSCPLFATCHVLGLRGERRVQNKRTMLYGSHETRPPSSRGRAAGAAPQGGGRSHSNGFPAGHWSVAAIVTKPGQEARLPPAILATCAWHSSACLPENRVPHRLETAPRIHNRRCRRADRYPRCQATDGGNTGNGRHAAYAPAGSRSKTAVLGAITGGIRRGRNQKRPHYVPRPLRRAPGSQAGRQTAGHRDAPGPDGGRAWHAPRAGPETAAPASQKHRFCPSGANLMQNLSQNQSRIWES